MGGEEVGKMGWGDWRVVHSGGCGERGSVPQLTLPRNLKRATGGERQMGREDKGRKAGR